MRTVITLPDHVHALAKRRAAEQRISFAEFARRLLDRGLDSAAPQGDLGAICAMVPGEPLDMAADGRAVAAGTAAAWHAQHSG